MCIRDRAYIDSSGAFKWRISLNEVNGNPKRKRDPRFHGSIVWGKLLKNLVVQYVVQYLVAHPTEGSHPPSGPSGRVELAIIYDGAGRGGKTVDNKLN